MSGKYLQEIIRTRRSARAYTPELPGREVIERVVEAGRYAPSGSNSQTTRFIVITSKEKLAGLAGAVTGALAAAEIREGMPPPFIGLINRAKQGPVDVNYGAPALIITANKKGYINAAADCSCALMNMMLACAEEGLGSCWINLYRMIGEAPPVRAFLSAAGLAADEEVCGALVLGYAEGLEKEPLPRKGNPVNYVG